MKRPNQDGGEVALPDLEKVAVEYHDWIPPHPFDIGHATMATMARAIACMLSRAGAQTTHDAAAQSCMPSKANGSLMRCTPMANWGHRMPGPQSAA